MISILLSFSRRVAGGVLRRKKSSTSVALKAHIGRLRSVLVVSDNDYINDQITHTKQPSPVEKNKTR
jgi:voltage-gated potassium channel Kch